LRESGLSVGPWLRDLKHALLENKADAYPIRIAAAKAENARLARLAALRSLVTITPGQKIAYVTDVANTPDNCKAIVQLVQGADLLFIEAPFAATDVALADDRAHLTTTAAGSIARKANVRLVEPFHFSPRYDGEEARLIAEVMASFGGERIAMDKG